MCVTSILSIFCLVLLKVKVFYVFSHSTLEVEIHWKSILLLEGKSNLSGHTRKWYKALTRFSPYRGSPNLSPVLWTFWVGKFGGGVGLGVLWGVDCHMHYRMLRSLPGFTSQRPGATPLLMVTNKNVDIAIGSPSSFLRKVYFLFFTHDLTKSV